MASNGEASGKLLSAALSGEIIRCALAVHSALGPGMLERVYRACLIQELRKAGLEVATELPIDIVYDGLRIEGSYRADLVVGNEVIVELKAVETLLPVHHYQLLTYLKLLNLRVGLLINFNVVTLVRGIRRIVNGP